MTEQVRVRVTPFTARSGGSSRFPRVGPGYLRAYDATIDRVGGDINLG
jgi:hypothetical protein